MRPPPAESPYRGMPTYVPGNGGPRRSTSGPAAGARILIVEDSPTARRLLQAHLTRLGIGLPDLRITATVPEAIQVFTAWKPHIAFVDLQLRPPPDRAPAPAPTHTGLPKDGGELVRLLLQRDPELQVIVCSATDPDLSNVAPLIRDGTVQSLVKPVLAARLQEVLARASAAWEVGVPPHRSAMT
ncbi:MAG: response regulator [Thermoplasmata archaeon]|nr:response regulator [Thermoplasmata archaeon]